MENVIILVILAVLVIIGIRSTVKHFQGKSSCCGGGGTYVSRKKLKNVIARKTIIIDGMTCENCKNRVERFLNDIDGAAAKVHLKKKEAVVSLDREISDEQLRAAVEKAGYTVIAIHH